MSLCTASELGVPGIAVVVPLLSSTSQEGACDHRGLTHFKALAVAHAQLVWWLCHENQHPAEVTRCAANLPQDPRGCWVGALAVNCCGIWAQPWFSHITEQILSLQKLILLYHQ
jgi:hypothetical protein